MNCPICGNEMLKGILTGDGRDKIRWEAEYTPTSLIDRIRGKGEIDTEYYGIAFIIHSTYCTQCKKMMFDTAIIGIL